MLLDALLWIQDIQWLKRLDIWTKTCREDDAVNLIFCSTLPDYAAGRYSLKH